MTHNNQGIPKHQTENNESVTHLISNKKANLQLDYWVLTQQILLSCFCNDQRTSREEATAIYRIILKEFSFSVS